MVTGSDLKDHLTLLGLAETGGALTWAAGPRLWGKVEPDTKRNLFSDLGIGARGATITLRRRPLDLHQALRWQGWHCFLTAILPVEDSPGFMGLKAALVHPQEWQADADQGEDGLRFPGILTERYLSHVTPDLHSEVHGEYVLITPKRVRLAPGSWVRQGKDVYRVEVAHTLTDEYKCEYELRREVDC